MILRISLNSCTMLLVIWVSDKIISEKELRKPTESRAYTKLQNHKEVRNMFLRIPLSSLTDRVRLTRKFKLPWKWHQQLTLTVYKWSINQRNAITTGMIENQNLVRTQLAFATLTVRRIQLPKRNPSRQESRTSAGPQNIKARRLCVGWSPFSTMLCFTNHCKASSAITPKTRTLA